MEALKTGLILGANEADVLADVAQHNMKVIGQEQEEAKEVQADHFQGHEELPKTSQITVLKLSGAVAFGPRELPRDFTVQGLKLLFEKRRQKTLIWGSEVLKDHATLASLPQKVVLYVAYTPPCLTEVPYEFEHFPLDAYILWEELHPLNFTDDIVYKASPLGCEPFEYVIIEKVAMDTSGVPQSYLREISVLNQVRHPNLIALLDVLVPDGQTRHMYLVREYFDLNLRVYLRACGPMDGNRFKATALDCFRGLSYCHDHMVMHRDIKPDVILIDTETMRVKIGGFALARKFSCPLHPCTEVVTTLWYRAPEILLEQNIYGPVIDSWSMGCVMYEMATRHVLFQGDSGIDMLFKIFKLLGTPTQAEWPRGARTQFNDQFPKWEAGDVAAKLSVLSPALDAPLVSELVRSCLQLDAIRRASARTCLEHELFKEDLWHIELLRMRLEDRFQVD